MRGLGVFLIMLGAGSFVLNLLDREFILLMWIDTWGPTAGITIRISMVVVGIGLLIVGLRGGGDSESE
jgi:hypothetical protein